MLIKCPECNREVSDKAQTCIHCGYPLDYTKNEEINVLYDIRFSGCNNGSSGNAIALELTKVTDLRLNKTLKIVDNLSTIKSNITLEEANKIKAAIEKVGGKVSITKVSNDTVEYDTDSHRESLNVPYCPKCGSTSITTSARGVDGFWGFLGASSTVNRCANCGHAWYPETGKSI